MVYHNELQLIIYNSLRVMCLCKHDGDIIIYKCLYWYLVIMIRMFTRLFKHTGIIVVTAALKQLAIRLLLI